MPGVSRKDTQKPVMGQRTRIPDMSIFDTVKEYLHAHNPKWRGPLLDLRTRLYILKVGERIESCSMPHQYIYKAAKSVDVGIRLLGNEDKSWDIVKTSHPTDSLSDIVFSELSVLTDVISEDEMRKIGFNIIKKIKDQKG